MIYEWFKNITFAWPENFILLGFIPFLTFWYLRRRARSQAAMTVSTTRFLNVRSARNRMVHWPFILRMLAVACIIVALARPQHRNDYQKTEGEGIDIMLCMDVSGSMGDPDIPPSRIEAAKAVAEEFVNNRPVDRIGLVIFSGESFTKCPITPDHNTLITQIKSLELRDGGYLAQGTLIGEGLATAVDRISSSPSKSRVIILLTDGKEDAPDTRLIDPLTALEIAKAKQVKVYTIGMGVGASSAEDIGGGRRASDDFLDEGLLQKIATETGGRFFRARDKDGLSTIYALIDKLEKSKVEIIRYKKIEDKFHLLILGALAFLLLEMVLRTTILKKFP